MFVCSKHLLALAVHYEQVNRHRAVLAEVIRMTRAKQQVITGPSVLPVVQYRSTRYFADLLLGQFRDIKNPHSYVDFDSEQGKLMCRQTGIVWCTECGMGVIISKAFERQTLRCMQCMDFIVPSFIE